MIIGTDTLAQLRLAVNFIASTLSQPSIGKSHE